MRLVLSAQQAEILFDASKRFQSSLESRLLTEQQTIALTQVIDLLRIFLVDEINSNDKRFEKIIESLVDEGNYSGISEDLTNIHTKIRKENELRKFKFNSLL